MATRDADPIKLEDAITLVKAAESQPLDIEHAKLLLMHEKQKSEIALLERKELQKIRVRWSNWILGAIVAIVAFDFVVVACTGLGVMRFESPYILPAFLGESIINIIGLAVIIVRFLFSDASFEK